MQNQKNATQTIRKRVPWKKGKLTGAKPPLRPRHVWSVRTKLQIEGRAPTLPSWCIPPPRRVHAAVSGTAQDRRDHQRVAGTSPGALASDPPRAREVLLPCLRGDHRDAGTLAPDRARAVLDCPYPILQIGHARSAQSPERDLCALWRASPGLLFCSEPAFTGSATAPWSAGSP
jgi:hypothetical protein